MPENTSLAPEWVDDKTINEVLFCREFLEEHPMVSVGGAFFTKDGLVADENRLKKEVYDDIKHHITTGLWKKVSNLVEVLRMECCVDALPMYEDRIHVANGTVFLDGSFSEEKDFCRNRLPVSYRPDAPEPVQWLGFLSQLLYPEDIPTLQEFFGYCLIPSTRGQKMLLITGKGGEGKSRVGIVLQSLLGSNMKTGSLSKVETSPFARADLQNMLVMVDDDMKMEALKQTNYIKSIVTAELPLDLEKKGIQSYQADMRVRFLAFGNGTLQALHDRSFGFFRRQIILEAKERDPNRKDNPYLAERLCEEKEGIFQWALEGLRRLIRNDFQFTISNIAGKIDVGLVAFVFAIIALLMKLAPQKEIIAKIPWNTIMMIGGAGMLIAVAVEAGTIDMLSAWIGSNVPTFLVPLAFSIIAAIMSFFSSTTGVVCPALFPLIPALAVSTGLNPAALFTCTVLGAQSSAISPFSSGGSLILGSCGSEEERNTLFNRLLFVAVPISVGICAVYNLVLSMIL